MASPLHPVVEAVVLVAIQLRVDLGDVLQHFGFSFFRCLLSSLTRTETIVLLSSNAQR
jgi:hypothetical protein